MKWEAPKAQKEQQQQQQQQQRQQLFRIVVEFCHTKTPYQKHQTLFQSGFYV